jgi:hypothetical protein
MLRTLPVAVVVFALGAVAYAGAGQQPQTAKQAQPTRINPVTVPTGDGAPVITDGAFSAGEWTDALEMPVADGVTMLLKEYRGVVFLGLRGVKSPMDMWLAAPGRPIEKLHVSFALIQTPVPPSGPEPKARLGFTTDWYANELRRDEEVFQRMLKEGRDDWEAHEATTYPLDGIEYAIRRSKVPGRVWLVRLFVPGSMVIYPPSTSDRTTDGWLELRFK